MKNSLLLSSIIMLTLLSCKKDPPIEEPMLHFKYRFDSTQVRYDSFGAVATVPPGHGAQSPLFHQMSSHFIELTPNEFTLPGGGEVLYVNEETTAGGSTAINHQVAVKKGNNEIFFSVPLKDVTPGTYEYLRVSLAYQNYDVKLRALSIPLTGRIASFIGYNSYITQFKIKDSTVTVNGNRAQGFWGFESVYSTLTGQAPPGATTVPNPIFATSPIPAGSCLVTGVFAQPLVISGDETEDITIVVSLSTNKSFEWTETDADNIYEPLEGDTVVDMGIRGMIPIVE